MNVSLHVTSHTSYSWKGNPFDFWSGEPRSTFDQFLQDHFQASLICIYVMVTMRRETLLILDKFIMGSDVKI